MTKTEICVTSLWGMCFEKYHNQTLYRKALFLPCSFIVVMLQRDIPAFLPKFIKLSWKADLKILKIFTGFPNYFL